MAKNRKKRWFEKGNESLFSNTIKKHDELRKKQRLEGDYFDDDYSSNNWEMDRKLSQSSSPDRKKRYEDNKKDYGNAYNSYEKTGVWSGYYRQPQLTYKYVQQMANALSIQHNIKIQIGNEWKVDLLDRTLTYNPASLIYGTKSELLATLMHEIGKLRHVTHHSLLTNKYLKMYGLPAREVLGVYEDLRTDFHMLKAYESAAEIYESIIPTIEEQVKNYMHVGEAFRTLIYLIPLQVLRGVESNCFPNGGLNPKDPKFRQQLFNSFGTSDYAAVTLGLELIRTNSQNRGTIYEWCGEMLSVMYDLDEQGHGKFENIKDKIRRTTHTIEKSKIAVRSQALIDYMDYSVYPVVEDLLKDAEEKNDAIDKAFPQMPAAMMKSMMKMIKDSFMSKYAGGAAENVHRKMGGPSNSTVPPEWRKGDYKILKDSVSMEIRALVRRLTFLRRTELILRYTGDQKRGKLNAKKLYKHSAGSSRLFKRKLENVDTIRSFAFSILLDVSGSMDGERITHTTRALIILTEVFKQMKISFEITIFSDGAKNIKPFGKDLDKTMEGKIGGLVNNSGDGTNLDRGLNELKIQNQPEKNKIVIVLTDGGVGDIKYFDNEFFIPWKKKGIKSIGIGIDCERQMANLCMGNTRMLGNASELPAQFSKLLKELIKR